jgi:hypothetical protein
MGAPAESPDADDPSRPGRAERGRAIAPRSTGGLIRSSTLVHGGCAVRRPPVDGYGSAAISRRRECAGLDEEGVGVSLWDIFLSIFWFTTSAADDHVVPGTP